MAILGNSIVSPSVDSEVSANLASVVIALIASPRVGVVIGGLRMGASCIAGLAEIGDGVEWCDLARCFVLGMGESSVDGDVDAKEMKEGPESVDRLVPRDLGGVWHQRRNEVEHTTSASSCSTDTS